MSRQHEQWDIVSSVGLTALAVAATRAIETSRPDPLATDPYAAKFVRAAQAPRAMPTSAAEAADPLWGLLTDFMALRTRFLDDFLTAAQPIQVVILAAGLDARAHRIDLPAGCRLFEVDQPKVLDFKQQVLDDAGARPGCERRTVPTDLRDDWDGALTAAGFDPDRPTAWLAEGLLPYLPPRAEEDLFDRVHKLSAPGSVLAAEKPAARGTEEMLNHPLLAEAGERFGIDLRTLWQTEPRRDCADWLHWAGWDTTDHSFTRLQHDFHRPMQPDVQDMMGRNLIVTAHRPT